MSIKHFFFAAVATLAFSACSIDRDYDLRDEKDMTVTVVPGATLPIGSLEPVSIGPVVRSLVKIQKQLIKKSDILDFDEGGNLCVMIDSSKNQVEYLIDSLAIVSSHNENAVEIPATFPSGWKSTEIKAEVPMKFSLQTKGLGTKIKAVREVNLEPMIWDLSIYIDELKGFTLCKGTQIILPDWAFISNVFSPFTQTSDHVMTLSEDFTVSGGLSTFVVVNRLFVNDGIDVPEESEMDMEGTITLKGGIKLSSADSDMELSGDHTLKGKASVYIPQGKFDTAEVKLGETPVVLNLMKFPMTLNLLTEFADLEPYDLECEFQVESQYPAGVDYSAILRIYDDEMDTLGEFPMGKIYGKPGIYFPPKMNTSLYFSGSGENAPEGAITYKIDGLLDTFREKESIMVVAFGSVQVSQDDDWVKIQPEVDYGFNVTTRAIMPLRLGKDASVAIDRDIHGFNVDTTMALDHISPIKIKMDAINTIPVDLNLHVEMIDEDGNIVEEYSPVVKSDIKAGTLDKPSTSEIEIGFNTDTIVPFDGMRINFSIGGGVMTNTPLNEKQAIALRNIVIEVPEGLTVDPKLIKYFNYLNKVRQQTILIISGM
jgi:hypothetical protein